MRYLRWIFLAALWVLVLFCGFGCTPSPVFTPTPVEVVVPVTCKVTIPPAPDWRVDHLPASATMMDKIKAIAADRELAIGYIGQLVAALEACNAPVT